jgi:hypothetical protein
MFLTKFISFVTSHQLVTTYFKHHQLIQIQITYLRHAENAAAVHASMLCIVKNGLRKMLRKSTSPSETKCKKGFVQLVMWLHKYEPHTLYVQSLSNFITFGVDDFEMPL